MTQSERAPSGLAHERESFRQQLIERAALLQLRAKLRGLVPQGLIGQTLQCALVDPRLAHQP